MILEIQNLHANVEGKQILKGLDLKIDLGKVNVIMGPNGSGKSTLSSVIMGHPKYEITEGKIIFDGKDITEMEVDERSKLGIFLSLQHPTEVSGLTMSSFLRTALNVHREEDISVPDFQKLLEEKMELLKIDKTFASRYLNEGFSGGEKKRMEILQMLMLDPKLAILDEIDSGLDIDALKAVASGVNLFMKPEKCCLIITHYKRILEHIKPDHIFIIVDGKIAHEGGPELADHLEEKGYGWITEDN